VTHEGRPTEEELLEQLKQLKVDDVMLQTIVALINLTSHKLQVGDHAEAKKGIDAARAIVPLCAEEQLAPIKEALSQLQMAYVQATQGTSTPEEAAKPKPEDPPKPDIWTPGGNS
jgi:cell division GTPase FtsZ